MQMLLAFLLLIMGGPVAVAQDFNTLVKEADRLEAVPNEKAALAHFKEALKLQPQNVYVLTKCSELCSRIGNREKNTASRDSYYAAAQTYARTALHYQPHHDEANVAMAIAIGRVALLKSGKEKIGAVKDIKKYADLALKSNNRNFKAWHIIGKWHYEVSNLNMMEKAATKVFYGGLPAASLKESIRAYEFAKGLNPGFVLNYLELAKAYERNEEKTKAISLLRAIASLPAKTEDDPRIKAEAAVLLKKWS
jgi:tetratricopeptide (TPR) repeat protein